MKETVIDVRNMGRETMIMVRRYLKEKGKVSLNKMMKDLEEEGIKLTWFEAVEIVRRLRGKFYVE